jgi:hypothetical protein
VTGVDAAPGRDAGSAGVGRHGRTLTPQPFSGDDGSAAATLALALEAHAAAPGPAALAAVVVALAQARVLVAVVAILGEGRPVADGPRADAGAEMALVTVTMPDSVRGLPVFSGVAALAGWDATARPVPVEGARAALSAVAEGCDRLIVDLAGPHPAVVPRPAVRALAQGLAWLPSPDDPDVAAAVTRAAAGVEEILGVRCEPGSTAELRVVVGVRPGLDRAGLDALLTRLGAALAAQQVVADRVDAIELRVLPA